MHDIVWPALTCLRRAGACICSRKQGVVAASAGGTTTKVPPWDLPTVKPVVPAMKRASDPGPLLPLSQQPTHTLRNLSTPMSKPITTSTPATC